MKCFVINLKRAEERRKYISTQLNQISQEFEFVEGVDWKKIDSTLLSTSARNIKIKNSFRTLTKGQMGCNLSHRKILKWLVNSSEKMIVVLEDDVHIDKDFPKILGTLETSSHPFDIVFLGSRFNDKQLVNIVQLSDKFSLSLSRAREKGAWGYVITKNAAQEFLKIFPFATGPIDDALHAYFLHGLKTYTLNPKVVFHEGEMKNFSYNTECKNQRLIFYEELMRSVSLIYEYISHKKHFWYRLRTERSFK